MVCYVTDEQGIRSYLKERRINSDYHPYLEFNLDNTKLTLQKDFLRFITAMRQDPSNRHIRWAGMSQEDARKWRDDFAIRYKVATELLTAHGEDAFLSQLVRSRRGLKLLGGYAPLLDLQSKAVTSVSGSMLSHETDPQQVLQAMDKLLSGDPEFGTAWLVKSMVLEVQGSMLQAFAAAEKAVRYACDCAESHAHFGMLLLARGMADAASKALSEAVRLKPDNPAGHYGLALALAHTGATDEALEPYREAIRLRPAIDSMPQFHMILAGNFAKQKRYQEAYASAKRALEIARALGDEGLIQAVEEDLATYEQMYKTAVSSQ
jgi:tetratricopeptide (TPR) repeat protein